MENNIEIQDAAGEIKPGDCKGNWDVNDPLCSPRSCVISVRCERITKEGKSKKGTEPQKVVQQDAEKPKVLSTEESAKENPVEYLLGVLKGRSECKENETDKVKMYQFREKDQPLIDIFISKSGKIRLVSKKGVKTLNTIDSVSQANAILEELL